MMKSQLKICLLACFSFLMFLTSCSNEDFNLNEYTDQALFDIEAETRSGKSGCYELVFPVTIDFPDGSSQEVEDLESLKSSIITWKEANEDVSGRPKLAFPYEVITEDGTLISVENAVQRRALRIKCKASMGEGPNANLGKPCFRLVYPITISFPDESTLEVASRRALKIALRNWKKNNPDAEEKPSIVYPIEVIFEDETTQTINSREDLKQLKEDCRG